MHLFCHKAKKLLHQFRNLLFLLILLLCVTPLFAGGKSIQNETLAKMFFIGTILLSIIAILLVVLVVITFKTKKLENEALMKSNTAKTEFLSNMSHEIRTPLSAIIGLNEIAKQNLDDSKVVADCLFKMNLASKHLLSIINDILDMAVIDNGKMTITDAPFSLKALLETIETVYGNMVKSKKLTFQIVNKTKFNNYICGDELHLKQILINLIANAIKYNKENGKIWLCIDELPKTESSLENSVCLRFSVKDTGIGILPQNQKKIFESFEREQYVKQNQIKGSGLGLTIAHRLCKLMGSELKLESVLNTGSNFWFEKEFLLNNIIEDVDIKTTDDSIVADTRTGFNLEGCHYIIAEDEELNSDVVESFLTSSKASAVVVKNGKKCCEVFEKSIPNFFDAILMDIKMPVMDGYDATKYIRSLKRPDAAKIEIIAMSANAFTSDIEKSFSSGMSAHFSKPVDYSKLLDYLSNHRRKL